MTDTGMFFFFFLLSTGILFLNRIIIAMKEKKNYMEDDKGENKTQNGQ